MADDPEEPVRSATAPLTTPSWLRHGELLTGTSFLAMLRRLPALLADATRLGWKVRRGQVQVMAVAAAGSLARHG